MPVFFPLRKQNFGRQSQIPTKSKLAYVGPGTRQLLTLWRSHFPVRTGSRNSMPTTMPVMKVRATRRKVVRCKWNGQQSGQANTWLDLNWFGGQKMVPWVTQLPCLLPHAHIALLPCHQGQAQVLLCSHFTILHSFSPAFYFFSLGACSGMWEPRWQTNQLFIPPFVHCERLSERVWLNQV